MTTHEIDLQPLREFIKTIWEMPEGQVSDPLALLEIRVRYALEAYDASEEEGE
jgi:hypothetical protein